MLKKQVEIIAQRIFDKLDELPTGTRTCTAELARQCGIEGNSWNELIFLCDIDYRLKKIVSNDGRFVLDSSHHDGKDEGFPCNLDFVIIRKQQ